MSTPLQSPISKIRREIIDQLDALENLATSKAKALETAEQRYLELERERDGLNRDQTELAARVDELKAQLADQATVPRVITAEELKPGQWIAVDNAGGWGAEQVDASWVGSLQAEMQTVNTSVVLLEDAPAEEPEPVKVGDTLSTEEQVKPLPRQTILRGCEGDALERGREGWWMAGCEKLSPSAELIQLMPFTVLYLPEEDS